MESVLSILFFLVCGMVTGFFCKRNHYVLLFADRVALFSVYGLLFILGAGLGADTALLERLPFLGAQALAIAFFCTAGSIACLLCLGYCKVLPLPLAVSSGPADGPLGAPFKGTLRILLFFAAGILLAAFGFLPRWLTHGEGASYALYVLVAAVGTGLGADLGAFRIVRDMHYKIIFLPLGVVLGTFAGAAAASLIPGITLGDALCVGAGLGYYSLSSILIEGSGNAALASVALMANIFREVGAILATPLLARFCGGIAPVAAAGATAMDTALPGIARFCGERYAVMAVFSGMTLTLLVPFLVTAVLEW